MKFFYFLITAVSRVINKKKTLYLMLVVKEVVAHSSEPEANVLLLDGSDLGVKVELVKKLEK